MNKKYRLKIPDQYKSVTRGGLLKMDGKTTDEIGAVFPEIAFPKDWLTPIEEGPVSFDDWDNEYSLVYKLYGPKLDREIKDRHGVGETLRNIIYRNRKAAWDACEQNDRKRTQPLIDLCRELFTDDVVIMKKRSSVDIADELKETLKDLEEDAHNAHK